MSYLGSSALAFKGSGPSDFRLTAAPSQPHGTRLPGFRDPAICPTSSGTHSWMEFPSLPPLGVPLSYLFFLQRKDSHLGVLCTKWPCHLWHRVELGVGDEGLRM